MLIKNLRIENFRNLGSVTVVPSPRLNGVWGKNGAGKSSLLEAIFLLARGKSFRTGKADELLGKSARVFRIFLEVERAGRTHRLGLERSSDHWKARVDGEDVPLLSQLTHYLPVVLMEPNSHLLVSGPPEGRRRLLDWGVFHVEPSFMDLWRRFSRVIKQRNAALRRPKDDMLDGLDAQMIPMGNALHEARERYFRDFELELARMLPIMGSGLDNIVPSLRPGWRGNSLQEAVQGSRKRDRDTGATHQGPHRADMDLLRDGQPVKSVLSRGEQKSLAAALLLVQARLMAKAGEPPLVLLDDLRSEFDREHSDGVLQQALECAGQVWVTGIVEQGLEGAHKVFHVERGVVSELV